MADIITTLVAKRRTLAERKHQVQLDAQKEVYRIDNELAGIDAALEHLNDAIKAYICPGCRGTGSIHRSDAAGGVEDVTCHVCGGTGVKLK